MGRIAFAVTLLLAPALVSAQERATGGIPSEVANAIAFLYNAPATHRVRGNVDIRSDSAVPGTLAVRGGDVIIGGHVAGSLVVINGDVTFRAGARVDERVYVVGGRVEGREHATIGGDLTAYVETLRYSFEGDELIVDDAATDRARRTREDRFWGRQQTRNDYTSFDFFTVAGANAYNRVEGYPILVGPRMRMRRDWGTLSVQARGIIRTAEPLEWDRGSTGHDARAELRLGNAVGFGFGGAAFDRVDAIQSWHLSDHETALAAVGLHRDYRDYYGRHGGRATVSLYLNDNASLTAGYGRERWESRDERDPWSLFRSSDRWRSNPGVDEGHVELLTGSLTLDSRNQSYSPGAGWFVQADVEQGKFGADFIAAGALSSQGTYTRGFLDVRRYNRLAPGAQFNVRMVLGGWMNGDALPLQRRLSVGGPGTLPGFDFAKSPGRGADHLQCSEGGGPAGNLPARCDRIALFQVEYRGDLSWHRRNDDVHGSWLSDVLHAPTWLVFANAGRGWRARDDGVTTYPIQSFPAFNTFKTDIGMGLDFGSASVSVAKSLSDRHEPANVILRLSRRF
jgi:hypothetical protein